MQLNFKELHLIKNADGETYHATIISDILDKNEIGTMTSEIPRLQINKFEVMALNSANLTVQISD
jgi:hypothetical protein